MRTQAYRAAMTEVAKNHEARQKFTQQQTENRMVLKARRMPYRVPCVTLASSHVPPPPTSIAGE